MGAERGSVLLLFPAAVLVMLVMASVTVDAAIAFQAQREVVRAVSAAANDAATLGLDRPEIYRRGQVVLDPGAVRAAAEARVRTALDPGRHRDLVVEVVTRPAAGPCGPMVEVRARSRVDYLFAGVVPGADDRAEVSAVARSRPLQQQGDAC